MKISAGTVASVLSAPQRRQMRFPRPTPTRAGCHDEHPADADENCERSNTFDELFI